MAIHSDGLQISRQDYAAALARIHEYLSAGHTYQVNFTSRVTAGIDGTPLEVYEALLRQQPVPYAAYLNRPGGAILSFSPELFFRTSQEKISARPMKGTWPRGVDDAGDLLAMHRLQSDEKNRSEHVMIVDLLRNDMGRLCRAGSVEAGELFHVERYATLLQMTSTITGLLRENVRRSEILRALFPSGSITGAPKRRTMEIIRELEQRPRGLYTGSIGYFGPSGEACFNVAIRTAELEGTRLSLGVGGGITADSTAEQEYEECILKASFLTRRRPAFSLIETMRCHRGIRLLAAHLGRLSASARYFDIRYDADALLNEITVAALRCDDQESRIRLELNEAGTWEISTSSLRPIAWQGRVLLCSRRTDSRDIFLHHKTTNRGFYEEHLREARRIGYDEVLFLNETGRITEGAISNIFLEVDGRWLTPALRCGVLPGVERASILSSLPAAAEAELSLADLQRATGVHLCNALRGIRRVHVIHAEDGTVLYPPT